LRREPLPFGYWLAGDAAHPCRNGIVTPWTSGQLHDDQMGMSRDAFNFSHSSLIMHVEQDFGILMQRFGIPWRKLTFSLPACTLVLSACFRLHNFCIDLGEESLHTVLQSEDRLVSGSSFRRRFSAMRKAQADQNFQISRGRRRYLEAIELREHMTHDIYHI
jgi:DDE superfamily endonuclease